VPREKIQLRGQFAIRRDSAEPLWLQIVRHLQDAIESGGVFHGTRLPSTRSLARGLRVSRNTVLAAYAELAARGLVWSRRGAALYVSVPAGIAVFDPKRVMREAQYPARRIWLRDQDGNPISISY
jgi:GntR family transcriptional regulator / MocR family aminotransferase